MAKSGQLWEVPWMFTVRGVPFAGTIERPRTLSPDLRPISEVISGHSASGNFDCNDGGGLPRIDGVGF